MIIQPTGVRQVGWPHRQDLTPIEQSQTGPHSPPRRIPLIPKALSTTPTATEKITKKLIVRRISKTSSHQI